MLQRRVCIYISMYNFSADVSVSWELPCKKLSLSLSLSSLFLSATFVHGRTTQREKKRKCWREPLQNRWYRFSQTNSQTTSTAKRRSLQVTKKRTVQLERTRSSTIRLAENLRLNISLRRLLTRRRNLEENWSFAKINIISYSRFGLSGVRSRILSRCTEDLWISSVSRSIDLVSIGQDRYFPTKRFFYKMSNIVRGKTAVFGGTQSH